MTARRKIIPIFVPHLGCPNQCVFCNQRRISGHSAVPEVEREIEQALPYSGQEPQVAFYGGSFTAIDVSLQEELLQKAHKFIREGKISSLRVSTRPDCVTEQAVKRLVQYGCDTVELGVQSLDDEVLRLTKRGHGEQCVQEAVSRIKAAGMNVILQMMTGLPGDSGRESIETAKKIIALQPDGVRIYPTVVLPDTDLADMTAAGTYIPQSVEEAAELCGVLLQMFEDADIPVIRVGLNPSEELESCRIGGAYHPALGELARNCQFRRKAELLIEQMETIPEKLTLQVESSRVSAMVGLNRRNVVFLCEKYGISEIKVIPGGEKGLVKIID